jgi:hypothetical protein
MTRIEWVAVCSTRFMLRVLLETLTCLLLSGTIAGDLQGGDAAGLRRNPTCLGSAPCRQLPRRRHYSLARGSADLVRKIDLRLRRGCSRSAGSHPSCELGRKQGLVPDLRPAPGPLLSCHRNCGVARRYMVGDRLAARLGVGRSSIWLDAPHPRLDRPPRIDLAGLADAAARRGRHRIHRDVRPLASRGSFDRRRRRISKPAFRILALSPLARARWVRPGRCKVLCRARRLARMAGITDRDALCGYRWAHHGDGPSGVWRDPLARPRSSFRSLPMRRRMVGMVVRSFAIIRGSDSGLLTPPSGHRHRGCPRRTSLASRVCPRA